MTDHKLIISRRWVWEGALLQKAGGICAAGSNGFSPTRAAHTLTIWTELGETLASTRRRNRAHVRARWRRSSTVAGGREARTILRQNVATTEKYYWTCQGKGRRVAVTGLLVEVRDTVVDEPPSFGSRHSFDGMGRPLLCDPAEKQWPSAIFG